MTVFHYALKPNGFLMLGRSETTGAHADLFTLIDKKQKIYSKKPAVLTGHWTSPPRSPRSRCPSGPGRRARPAPPRGRGGAEVNRLILDRYAPPGVLVDDDLHIVRTRGHTGRYLELAAAMPSSIS